MTDVFIYDHVRTPRGRGKKDGSLHEVPSVRLAAKVLEALRDRNGLDTNTVDDIITNVEASRASASYYRDSRHAGHRHGCDRNREVHRLVGSVEDGGGRKTILFESGADITEVPG